jgi:hypothetical protein
MVHKPATGNLTDDAPLWRDSNRISWTFESDYSKQYDFTHNVCME